MLRCYAEKYSFVLHLNGNLKILLWIAADGLLKYQNMVRHAVFIVSTPFQIYKGQTVGFKEIYLTRCMGSVKLNKLIP